MDDQMMAENEAPEAEGAEREICVHVGPDGALDVDGEPAADIGAALKLVMSKIKELQASTGSESDQFQAGFDGVRGGM